jgi:flavin reductase (DIM6/NTAB) family NADH-FMN oxidoreductase RutF
MFYDAAKNDHGLPYNPFKAIVAPRPIGWISSMSLRGEINLAPYSFFNGLTDHPPTVMFASEGRKDSVVFVEEAREFVCNFAALSRTASSTPPRCARSPAPATATISSVRPRPGFRSSGPRGQGAERN